MKNGQRKARPHTGAVNDSLTLRLNVIHLGGLQSTLSDSLGGVKVG